MVAHVCRSVAIAHVVVWPEMYNLETGRWEAIDIVFAFVAKYPVVEWMHRGTPMLWVCAAEAELGSNVDCCTFVDVTPRYSPCWWRVEQARGPRVVQQWWEATLNSLSVADARLNHVGGRTKPK